MANLTAYAVGTTTYPTVFDSVVTVNSTTQVIAAHPNGLGAGLIAMQTECGILPRGAYANVKTRLNAVDTNITNLTAASATIPTARGSGQIVQQISTIFTGATLSSSFIVSSFNDVTITPFTATMGTSFGDTLSVNMKPRSTSNAVYVQAVLNFANPSSGNPNDCVIAGLFVAASSSAHFVHFTYQLPAPSGGLEIFTSSRFLWKATTVSTATTSYILRFLPANSNAIGLNSSKIASNSPVFNNSLTSSLTVYEVQN